MALDIEKTRLRCFIKQMYDEGIVNDQFCQLQSLKESTKPDYALRAATTYCISAQNLFTWMSLHMEQPEVNYCQVNLFARELYSRSISIGAEHVTRACISIIQACDKKNKQECNQALYLSKNEYCNLRRRFETLVQVRSAILLSPDLRLAVKKVVRMAMSILNGLLHGYVRSLIDEGILNNQFSTLKSTEERGAFVQVIDMYCVDVDAIFLDLRNCIDLPEVDFFRLTAKAHKIEETSSSVGAEQVRLACKDLIEACDEKNKENVSRALTWLKNEFGKTKNKLETIAQMERRIIRLEQKEGVCATRLSDPLGVRRTFLPK